MGMKPWTGTLSSGQSLQIVASMNVMQISYQMSAGASDSGTVNGSISLVDGNNTIIPTSPITIGPGGGNTVGSVAGNRPVDGLTLTCTTGTMYIIIGF